MATDQEDERAHVKFLESRENDVAAIGRLIDQRVSQNLILTGKSGVGKSTIVRTALRSVLGRWHEVSITEYDFLFSDLVASLSSITRSADTHKKLRDAITAFNSYTGFGTERIELLELEFELLFDMLDRELPEASVLFIFDQAERLLIKALDAESGQDRQGDRIILATGRLLDWLRRAKFACPLYIIRSEYVVGAISYFLEHSGGRGKAVGSDALLSQSLSEYVSVYTLNGINASQNADVFVRYEQKFRNCWRGVNFERLSESLSLKSQNNCNTFYTHLTGYVIEHFVETDIAVREFAEGKRSKREVVIKKYFEYLGDEYAWMYRRQGAKAVLDLVLYTIAVENQKARLPISAIEIAQLAHHPLEEVEACIRFLEAKEIVVFKDENLRRYRIAHDLFIDYIISSEHERIRSEHCEAIIQLSESRTPKSELIVPEITLSIFDIFSRGSIISFPQIAILTTMMVCLARLFFPEKAFSVWRPVNDLIDGVAPGAIKTFDFGFEFYLPIIFMQIFWVSYMYYLDRGYFQYVLRSEPLYVRLISRYSAPAGGVAGCLVAFAPSFAAIPIIVGAIGCATVYAIHSGSKNVAGSVRINNKDLSIKIYGMSLVMAAFTFILYKVLKEYNNILHNREAMIIIWLTSLCLFGYWWAMRARQGSQAGRSSLLAMYDRGRTLGGL